MAEKPFFVPRPAQQEILRYRGGRMGVSAVPGSGKTHILSYLAARLVATSIDEGQEVLVVTMMNSAVDNFTHRIAAFIQAEAGLLPNVGYRVRTLHGLANDIVHERPGLVGLSENFGIVDERDAEQMLTDIVQSWAIAHTDLLVRYLAEEIGDQKQVWIARNHWPELVLDTARAFIRRAKDLRMTPQMVQEALRGEANLTLAQMASEIYDLYQRALLYRGAVDFDDLIVLALRALEEDPDLVERLRMRWPFILEDEAQDSSQLQQEILEVLAGPNGNWVRVGDPNQSIHTTFTTANPRFLRDFITDAGTKAITMPNSGRSTPIIIALANHLVDWATTAHPSSYVRDAFERQHIEPAPPGDPQPNPSAEGRTVYIDRTEYTPEAEVQVVVESLARWLPEHSDETVAVLTPRNERGFQVADALRRRNIPLVELLRSTMSTRQAAGALAHVLRHLVDPTSPAKLARAFEVWRRDEQDDENLARRNHVLVRALRSLRQVEDYLWPRLDRDWLAELEIEPPDGIEAADLRELLAEFREQVQRWHWAASLPVDQLLLTVGQDLFDDPGNLALTHKLATVLRQMSDDHPSWRLPDLTEELAVIARNERRFLGFDEADTGFDPPQGVVTVATMHKAKGLEWDRVYLMSVNNYNFPSEMPYDTYIAEKWFIRDHLNLEAETLAQLEALADPYLGYEEGRATLQARRDYVEERLRLLYVGITRARKDLIITWNNGKGRVPLQPAVPLLALHTYWEQNR